VHNLLTSSHLSVGTVELLIKTYPDGKVSGYMNALKVKICDI
jgi:NAD(P)H-flavin reductase